MPYIESNKRKDIYFHLGSENEGTCINIKEINSVGELNYAITMLCKEYFEKQGKSYKIINDIIGVLECAKLEYYRIIAEPYEEEKRQMNGDVY